MSSIERIVFIRGACTITWRFPEVGNTIKHREAPTLNFTNSISSLSSAFDQQLFLRVFPMESCSLRSFGKRIRVDCRMREKEGATEMDFSRDSYERRRDRSSFCTIRRDRAPSFFPCLVVTTRPLTLDLVRRWASFSSFSPFFTHSLLILWFSGSLTEAPKTPSSRLTFWFYFSVKLYLYVYLCVCRYVYIFIYIYLCV